MFPKKWKKYFGYFFPTGFFLNNSVHEVTTMKTIEEHIQYDLEHVNDPSVSSAARRHFKADLEELQEYAEHHKEEIQAGDHHDPNALELFCDLHPDEPECLIYDD